MRKILSLLAVLMLWTVSVIAQNRVITGQVKDDKGDPIPFASVTIKGTQKGTQTDANGNFRIEAKTGDVLVISAVGSKEREVAVGSSNSYNVSLDKSGALQEVVVTALGVQKQPKELGYSVARVKGSDITEAKVTNLQNGLVGKVSGLNVTTANNGVFADTRIVLRGIRSLTGNNQPLLVVDGSPINLNFINSINPNDVENVNVLKGANAAALYGPEGVNGVIVVTTKKGSGRSKPQINVSNTTLFERVMFMPDFQSRFGSGSSYDANGDGVYDPIENQTWGPAFDGTLRRIGRVDENGNEQLVPYSLIKDEKFKFFNESNAMTIQNDVSVNSGDERSNFYLSVQDLKTKGVVPGDERRRTTFRANAGRTYGKVRISTNLSYTAGSYDATSSLVYWYVANTPQQVPLTSYKNFLTDKWSDHNHYFNDYYPNPYEDAWRNRQTGRSDDLVGNFEVNFKPVKWLNIMNRSSLTLSNTSNKNFSRAITYSDFALHNNRFISGSGNVRAGVSDGMGLGNRVQNELILSGDKDFGKFNVKALAGNLIRQTYSKSIGVSGSNLVIPTLFNVGNRTGEPGASESNFRSRLVSAFGSVSVGYNNFAFIEFTGRNDWDSRLPINNNSYFYPGVNASVSLTDAIESLGKSKWLSYAKLKAAWAKAGNVNVSIYGLESNFGSGSGFPYGNVPGYTAFNTINNPTIRPEVVESYELGGEFSFFNNRVSFDAAYYYQNNNDQVINVNISQSTGYAAAVLNAARFYNKGFEFDLRLTPLVKLGKLVWNFSGNLTTNDSKVLEVYGDLNELSIGNTSYAIKGYPAFTHKLTDWLRDDQGRVIIDETTGYPKQNTAQTIFGRTNPKYIVGLNTDLNYAGFTLKVVAEYRGGNFIYNNVGADLGFTGVDRMSAINNRQRFVFPNSVYWDGSKYVENTSIVVTNAHYDFLQAGRFRNTQTNYYTSAAFWKLREVVLSYDIPQRWLGSVKVIKKASVSLIGRNLLTLRPKTNWWTDPEFSNTTGNAVGTTTIGQTPPTRIYGFNVNVTF
ncbi:MAG: SusC/RagA family TonB-linked outer membrane protein [Chitinophagaceae bacterium]|uniref:SusC/RagA family TonB-linked outer membrane protein n=1 Tax=unclassified Paraflavitalea TaxID=2798305 RepID=UPI003D355E4E|nr:SusC/RagA family TonB-linked outer membrane protein [Chitinophagaceae bacterium]